MHLSSEPFSEGIIVHAEGARIDAACAIEFMDRLAALTETSDGRVVLDLGRVTFIDSSGLGAIVASMKRLAPTRMLELAALTHAVARVFRLTRMDSVFRIHASVEAAAGRARSVS